MEIDYKLLCEQYQAERDLAIEQLNDLGISFSENPKRKAINIQWFHKELVDEQCKGGAINGEVMEVFFRIIARWRDDA